MASSVACLSWRLLSARPSAGAATPHSRVARALCAAEGASLSALPAHAPFRVRTDAPSRNLQCQAAAAPDAVESGIRKNRLGNSDLLVTEVCMGTMTMGKQSDESESHSLLDAAWEGGVNFLDVAEGYPVPPSEETYGVSEEIVGRWMRKRDRAGVIAATKIAGYIPEKNGYMPGKRRVPPTQEPEENRLNAKYIREACEASLRRMQTDYIDLYQLHWPDRYAPIFGSTAYDPSKERESTPIRESVEALGKLIKEGKIRHYGLSNETTYGVCEFCHAADALGVPRPISIQNSFSLIHRSFETELAEACAPSHYNIGLLPWSPLAGGALSAKYLGGVRPPNSRFTIFAAFMQRFAQPDVEAVVGKYVQIAKEAGVTPAQLALAWCKSRWYVSSTIIGATTHTQLKENLDAFSVELSADVLAAIDAVHLKQKDPCMGL